MLTLDLQRLMELREIQNPRGFLVKAGFTYHAAGRLLKSELAELRYIEKLCVALNCTPDDLFGWVPDKGMRHAKGHALEKLAGRKRKGSIVPKLKNLPEDKLEQLHQFIDKLTGESA